MTSDKAIVTCALTGVLTNPKQHPVPVTPEQLAVAARQARDAGAAIVHVHFRNQEPDLGYLPSWDPAVAKAVSDAIKAPDDDRAPHRPRRAADPRRAATTATRWR